MLPVWLSERGPFEGRFANFPALSIASRLIQCFQWALIHFKVSFVKAPACPSVTVVLVRGHQSRTQDSWVRSRSVRQCSSQPERQSNNCSSNTQHQQQSTTRASIPLTPLHGNLPGIRTRNPLIRMETLPFSTPESPDKSPPTLP